MHGLFLLHDLSNKTMDTILSYGERLSTQIVVHLVDDIQLYDARQFIKTEHSVPNHTIDIDLTYRLIRETFQSEFGDRPKAAAFVNERCIKIDKGDIILFGILLQHPVKR
jgi:hypothetical protein